MKELSEGYECSVNQKGLWSAGGQRADEYYNQIIVSLDKGIDADQVRHAIQLVRIKHEILSYRTKENINSVFPVQAALFQSDIEFQEVFEAVEESTDLTDLTQKYLSYTYDPFVNDPIRFCFIKIPDTDSVLIIRLYSLWADTFSVTFFRDELYKAISNNEHFEKENRELLEYRNFSAWQNDLMKEPEPEGVDFWQQREVDYKNKILPFINAAELPFKSVRKQMPPLEGPEYIAFKKLCSLHALLPGDILLAVFINYLSEFTDKKVTVGYRPYKRSYEELNATLGLVTKTLPVTYRRKSASSSLLEAAIDLRSIVQEIEEWADYFFLPGVDTENNEQFQYGFEFADLSNEPQQETLAIKDLYAVHDPFILKLFCYDDGTRLTAACYFDAAKLRSSDIELITAQLAARLRTPADVVADVPVLSLLEETIITDLNATATLFEPHQSVLDLFKKQVAQTPEKVALTHGNDRWSYAELDLKSDQFASYLCQQHQLKKGQPVAIFVPPSLSLIAAILGVLKSGAYYVPIDPEIPHQRAEFIIKDCNATIVLGEQEILQHFNWKSITPIDLHDGRIYATSAPTQAELPDSDSIAYCIYTSGSTGSPKGCMITHENLLNYIQWANACYFDMGNRGDWGLTTSLAFDLTITSLFTSLTRGRTLWMSMGNKELTELLEEFFGNPEIDTLKLTPSHLTVLKELGIKSTNITTIICGGEQLTKNQVQTVWDINENIRIFNEYGPTETTVGCMVKKIEREEDKILIGKPIANTEIYIWNEQHETCPVGVTGEIVVGGKGVSNGYLNYPELMLEKFIESSAQVGKYVYKTGDNGRLLPDGFVEYIGRNDDQVKINGYRVELNEIANVLLTYEGVQEAIVLTKQSLLGAAELAGYIVSDQALNVPDIRAFLLDKFPPYMVPVHYLPINRMPLTPNGKIDKKALREYTPVVLAPGAGYKAPASSEEKIMVSVWEDVLKRQGIGIRDNFYNLGGDSIKSIQIVSRLRQKDYKIKVQHILQNPILEDLALLMVKSRHFVEQSDVVGNIGLTPIQQYFFTSPDIFVHNHYNQSILLACTELDLSALEQSITRLIRHHDVLRVNFERLDGQWLQFNQATLSGYTGVKLHDIREEADEDQAILRIGQELQSSLHIEKGPLLQVVCFRLKTGYRIGIIIHHLLMDGVSWRILLEDLASLYLQFKNGDKAVLPLKTDSFQSWALLLKDYADSPSLQSEKAYWQHILLQKIPPFPMETDKVEKEPAVRGTSSFTLQEETTGLLQTTIHQVYNTDINDLLLTGLGLAIKDVTGVDKSIIKMEGHGREEISPDIDVSRTVGWFTSVFPFILDLSKAEDMKSALIRVKEDLRQIPQKGIGFGILKYLAGAFSADIEPTIVFNYLGDFGESIGSEKEESVFEYASEAFGPNIDPSNDENILLDVSGILVAGKLTLSISYPRDKFSATTIRKLTDSYAYHLESLIRELEMNDAVYLTPSDLTFKGLSLEELDEINAAGPVEDIYGLSPLQQGLYYEWLADKNTTQYFEQSAYWLTSAGLQPEKIRKAYELLVDRYSILRTGFSIDFGGQPLQIVRKNVPDNFSLRVFPKGLSKAEREEYLEKEILADRDSVFSLEDPSQMRLRVLDFGASEYAFIWSHHHILMDGWCMEILINDFGQILDSLHSGSPLNLAVPIPYSKYIKWLEQVNKEESLRYWKSYLDGQLSTAELPFKLPGSDGLFWQGVEELKVEGELYTKMQAFCSQSGITQNIFVQCVWGYLLAMYNSAGEVVFGEVVSGRPGELRGVEEMIGLFSNTVPVRIRCEPTDTPMNLLKRTQQQAIASIPHHYVNLSEVQSQSAIGRGLINHIIAFQNHPIEERIVAEWEDSANGQNLDIGVEFIETFEHTNYDFGLTVVPSADSMTVYFNYNGYKYVDDSIKCIARHFHSLILPFMEQVDQPLSTLNWLSEEEIGRLLETSKGPETDRPNDRTVLDLFYDQVKQSADSVAVKFNNKQLTYRELDDLSNQLANYLQAEYAVGVHDLVALKLLREEWLIVAMLGVLKSGAAYVPIDPGFPMERINDVLQETSCRLCIDQTVINRFTESKNQVNAFAGPVLSPNDLAYVIFTSGSTGKPKGTMVEHRNLVAFIENLDSVYGFEELTTIAATTNYTFDISILELLGSVCTGRTAIIFSEQELEDPERFMNKLDAERIQILQLTPSRLLQLGQEFHTRAFPHLKIILVGGEALREEQYLQLKLRQGVKSYNCYGPTETTIWSTCLDIVASDRLSIGRPLRQEQVYLLNAGNDLVPTGVPGELCIGGQGVARGYLNRPELTSEKFIQHPFRPGERLYKTGDLARWLPDGTLEYLGRSDDQVKLRGHRIELNEIVTALGRYEGLEAAVVLLAEQQLIAYYVSKTALPVDKMQQFLGLSLPQYMIPQLYVRMDELPMTPSGKIDKRALLSSGAMAEMNRAEYFAADSETEELLVNIWEAVLGVPNISTRDNFFFIGGNSLHVVQLLSKINKTFRIKLNIEDVFNEPTIKEIAGVIDRMQVFAGEVTYNENEHNKITI